MKLFLLFAAGTISLGSYTIAKTLTFAGPVPPAQQQDFSKVEIKTTKAGGNVYMLEGQGGNIGISAGEDGVLMIDDQFAPLETKLREAIKKISEKPIRFLVNTHFHADHTGGNEKFGADSTVIAHKNVRGRLLELTGNHKPMPKPGLPVITYEDRISLHFNGEEIVCFHSPKGHTDGDSAILFKKSNVIHMGDLYFAGRFPFVDLRSGGSVRGLIAGVEKIIKELPADAKVIPGHGPLSTVDDLKQYLAFLKDAREIVKKGVDAGKDLKKLQEEKVLAKYEQFSWAFINTNTFIEFLVTDVEGDKEK